MESKVLSALVGVSTAIGLAFTNLGIYAHEYAHRSFANLLYRNARVKIEINSLSHSLLNGKDFGTYEFNDNSLSAIGQYFGERISNAMTIISGTVIDTSISLALYALGESFRRTRPNLSIALKGAGCVYFLSTLYHIKSTILSKTGDLYNFSEMVKIDPIVTSVAFGLSLPLVATIPPAIAYLRTGIKKYRERHNKQSLSQSTKLA